MVYFNHSNLEVVTLELVTKRLVAKNKVRQEQA